MAAMFWPPLPISLPMSSSATEIKITVPLSSVFSSTDIASLFWQTALNMYFMKSIICSFADIFFN